MRPRGRVGTALPHRVGKSSCCIGTAVGGIYPQLAYEDREHAVASCSLFAYAGIASMQHPRSPNAAPHFPFLLLDPCLTQRSTSRPTRTASSGWITSCIRTYRSLTATRPPTDRCVTALSVIWRIILPPLSQTALSSGDGREGVGWQGILQRLGRNLRSASAVELFIFFVQRTQSLAWRLALVQSPQHCCSGVQWSRHDDVLLELQLQQVGGDAGYCGSCTPQGKRYSLLRFSERWGRSDRYNPERW